jgi:arylsulfatase A
MAKPNIVFILADDLGYGEVGAYGQKKIRTPRLDRLAGEGMRFTQHYAGSPVCAPSRCVLLTGRHPGSAYIRSNREVRPEGQEPLPENTVTLARLLQQQGYVTGAFGKWGLGPPGSSGDPLNQGFDRFFGYNCQRVAHSFYPTHLWDNNRRVPLNNHPFDAHQRLPEDADPKDPTSYARYQGNDYAPDSYLAAALQFIRENKDRPFFLYFPTLVPHLAIQVPEDSLAEYLGKWPDPPYIGDNRYLPHFTPRAGYAAMITRMDRDIGRIVDLIEELDLDENTLIVFTSDNGPTFHGLGGADTEFFESAGPFRGLKGSLYEGGIRVPMIARWKGRVQPGTVSAGITGFEDWLPTLLDLIGASEAVPKEIDGISFAATLIGEEQPKRPFLYREFPGYGGQQSLYIGDWKGIRQNLRPPDRATKPSLHIELYNLKSDPGETQDLSESHPEIVAQIRNSMREQRTPSALFPIPALDEKHAQ